MVMSDAVFSARTVNLVRVDGKMEKAKWTSIKAVGGRVGIETGVAVQRISRMTLSMKSKLQ